MDAELVADLQRVRHLILELFVQDIGRVTRWPGNDNGSRCTFAAQRFKAVLYCLIEGFREAAELADVGEVSGTFSPAPLKWSI